MIKERHHVRWSAGAERPRLLLPPGAVDCHHHIYDQRFPAVANATLRPGDASIEDYRALQRRLGTARNVIVHPSTYGVDNSLLISALEAFGDAARGVCVIRPDAPEQELQQLHKAGVRAVRLNLLTAGAILTDAMIRPLAERVAPFGWHVELNMAPDHIVEHAEVIQALPCPVVFDHMAHLSLPDFQHHRAFIIMISLLRKGRAWVKLSALYNDTTIGPPSYADRIALAHTLVDLAPHRLVWGSDWPHPTESDDNKPNDADLLDLIQSTCSSNKIKQQIFVRNPENLYDFTIRGQRSSGK